MCPTKQNNNIIYSSIDLSNLLVLLFHMRNVSCLDKLLIYFHLVFVLARLLEEKREPPPPPPHLGNKQIQNKNK